MRRPVTDIALLAFIAKRKASTISYSDATEACKSSSSASRALHQLINEGMIQPQPKLVGLRYTTQYAVTAKGRQVAQLALHITELRNSPSPGKVNQQQSERKYSRRKRTATKERAPPPEALKKTPTAVLYRQPTDTKCRKESSRPSRESLESVSLEQPMQQE